MNYQIQAAITAGAQPAVVTYDDVKGIFTLKCVTCHPAGNPLDLTVWPFKSTKYPAPADTVREALARIRDDNRPMPPVPGVRLTADQVQELESWLDGGLLEKQPAGGADLTFAQTISVKLKWNAAGSQTPNEIVFHWNDQARFEGALVGLVVGSTIDATLAILGEDGATLSEKVYSALPVLAAGDFPFTINVSDATVRAHVVDRVAPAPGGAGVVAAAAVEMQTFGVTWQKATDQLSGADQLSYAVFVSETPGLATIDALNAGARKVLDFTPNIFTQTITGLQPGVKYYVTVVVKDAGGNVSLYKELAQEAARDKTPPAVTTPQVQVTLLSDQQAKLVWTAAADNLSPKEKLKYSVYSANANVIATPATAEQNGNLAAPGALNKLTMTLGGMVPSTAYYINVVVEDENGNKAAYATVKVTTKAATANLTGAQYAKQCADRLGSFKPANCFDGQIVPITVNGTEMVPNMTAAQAQQFFFGTGTSQQKCDKPPLLGLDNQGHCIPYTRIQRVKSYRKDGSVHPDVDSILLCRRYFGRVGKWAFEGQQIDGSVWPKFEDIAILQHNRVTGETCYFQMLMPAHASKDGRRVPPPTEVQLPPGAPAYAEPASTFWISPQDTAAKNCNNCHDSDIWIHSPYIDQAHLPDGKQFVFSGVEGGGKYSAIGATSFDLWVKPFKVASKVTTDTNGKSCTTCHVIGTLNTCNEWVKQSVGRLLAPNGSTKQASDFHFRFWMPPDEPGLTSQQTFISSGYERAAQRLLDCCANPQSAECEIKPNMTTPPAYSLD